MVPSIETRSFTTGQMSGTAAFTTENGDLDNTTDAGLKRLKFIRSDGAVVIDAIIDSVSTANAASMRGKALLSTLAIIGTVPNTTQQLIQQSTQVIAK